MLADQLLVLLKEGLLDRVEHSVEDIQNNIPEHAFHLVGDDEAQRAQRPLIEESVATRYEGSQKRKLL